MIIKQVFICFKDHIEVFWCSKKVIFGWFAAQVLDIF